VRPLLSWTSCSWAQVPERVAGAVDARRKWRKALKSTDIVCCYRHKKLDYLRGDTALTNRWLMQ
jgi:hypothetical protein